MALRYMRTKDNENLEENILTSSSQGKQQFKPENSSLALAISIEPHLNLSPYIKAFDNSIIP